MDDVLGYAILLSPVLLLPALFQRRWSRRRAISYLGMLTGALTALYAWIDWGGSADERMTRGFATIYGIAVSAAALAIGALSFMMNPPKPADEADRG